MKKWLYCLPAILSANPTGMEIIAGSGNANAVESVLRVHASDRSIIHWDTFSIAAGERTQFILPDANAAVLNRVTGGNMSELLGSLEANGQIYLINPQGILIGQDARIDTASFIASTLDVLSDEFIAKADLFFQGDSTHSIVNLGKITTQSGDCILCARHIKNEGTIASPQGSITLASGTQILLKPAGRERIFIQAAEGNCSIENAGQMAALSVEIQASGNAYASAIRHDGQIEASAIKKEDGRVLLVADQGRADITGSILAKEITVQAKDVYVTENALLDVSSENGGGVISLNASKLISTETTSLKADAIENGDGGRIFMLGRDLHYFAANVSAKGGAKGGHGGFVEASTFGIMEPLGLVDTSAPLGICGSLLYDPTDIAIVTTADTNVSITFDPSTNTKTYNIVNPLLVTNINNITLQTNLAANNVIISTESAGIDAGDITFTGGAGFAPVVWTPSGAATTLTLFANRDCVINANVGSTSTGNLAITSTRDTSIFATSNANTVTVGHATMEGDISLTSNRAVLLGANNTSWPAAPMAADTTFNATNIQTQNGHIAIRTTDYYDNTSGITLQGGFVLGGVNAPSVIEASGTGVMSLNTAGVLNLFAAVSDALGPSNVNIQTNSGALSILTGDATLSSGNTAATGIVLQAASVAGGSAVIQTLDADIDVVTMNGGNLSLNGAAANVIAGARLVAAGVGNISATIDGNVTITGNQDRNVCGIATPHLLTGLIRQNLSLTGSSVNALGVSIVADSLDVTILGSSTLTGGATTTGNSLASIETAQDGSLQVGGALALIGGAASATGQGDAKISFGKTLNIDVSGNLFLGSNATGTGSANAMIQGAVGGGSANPLTITVGGDTILFAGANVTSGLGNAWIDNFNSAPLTLSNRGDLIMVGGAGASAVAQIGHNGSNGHVNSGALQISANHIFMYASDATASANSYVAIGTGNLTSSETNNGNITVNAAHSILLQGGLDMVNASFAQIGHFTAVGGTTGGDVVITAQDSIELTGAAFAVANGGAYIGHGPLNVGTIAPHTVTNICGRDLILFPRLASSLGAPSIRNFSPQSLNAITLFADNKNTTESTQYGTGAFLFYPDADITAAGLNAEVRIYSSVRIFNTTQASGASMATGTYWGSAINGANPASSTLGTDTLYEVWNESGNPAVPGGGAVYPGAEFVIYYKRIGGILINNMDTAGAIPTVGGTPFSFSGGVPNFPPNNPEVWLKAADITASLATTSTTIDAEQLQGASDNGMRMYIGPFTGTQITLATNNTLTLTAGNDIQLTSLILPLMATNTSLLIDAGRDFIMGNGVNAFPNFIAPANITVNTGRDGFLLDGLSFGVGIGGLVSIFQVSDAVFNIGRDLNLIAANNLALIEAVGPLNCTVGRNCLQQASTGFGGTSSSIGASIIQSVSTHPVTLSIGGQHVLQGGWGSWPDRLSSDIACAAAVTIDAPITMHTVGTNLTLIGGTAGGNGAVPLGQLYGSSAVIDFISGIYNLNVTGDITLTGGVGAPATIQASGSSDSLNIIVGSGNIILNGAAGQGSYPTITAAPDTGGYGTANIQTLMGSSSNLIVTATSGDIRMSAGTGPTASALIQVLGDGLTFITTGANLTMNGSSGWESVVKIDSTELMVLSVGGNGSLLAGSGTASIAAITTTFNSPAGIGLALTVTGNLTLSGGDNYNSSSGFYAPNSDILVAVGGDLLMTAGNGPLAYSYFLSESAVNLTVFGNLTMNSASTGNGSAVKIGSNLNSAVSNTIRVDVGQNLIMNANGYTYCNIGNGGGFGAPGLVSGNITVGVDHDIVINAAPGGAFSPYMQLAMRSLLNANTQLTANGGFSSIGHLNVPSGSGTYSGDISVTAGGSITLNGGSSASLFTQIGHGGMVKVGTVTTPSPATDTFSGAVSVIASHGSVALNSTAPLGIYTASILAYGTGNALSTFAGNSTFLSGGAKVQGDSGITMISGVNQQFSGHPLILDNSMVGISIVSDNLFPTPPQFGLGALHIDSTTISTLGPLRLYSVVRSLNSIVSSTFNGFPFIPGPLGVDSPTEKWGLWYPQIIGGVPFTFFYKIVALPPAPFVISAFENQILYLLSANSTLAQFRVRNGAIGPVEIKPEEDLEKKKNE